MRLATIAAALWMIGATTLAEETYRWVDFAEDLVDLRGLTRVDFLPTRMETSYDRTGANLDGFNPDCLRDGVYTIADLKGPGVIRRFYAARPGGHLRIYIDGSLVIDTDCEELFTGRHFPFTRPAVGPLGAGNYCFLPLTYARTIKIQTTATDEVIDENSYGRYYQVTHQRFPPDAQVQPFTLPLSKTDTAAWQRILELWKQAGEDPKPVHPRLRHLDRQITIDPGKAVELARLSGPAEIDRLYVKVDSKDPHVLRSTLLQIWWDEEAEPGVDCPIGDFFGNGYTRVPYRSLPMGLTDDGYYCFFVMPFQRQARFWLLNEAERWPINVTFKLAYHETKEMAENQGYFQAKWRRQEVVGVDLNGRNTTGRDNYRILDVLGEGRFVGTNFNVFSRDTNWWGEGDPMIFVDQEKWPSSFHGTGTEEYFNDAFGFNPYNIAPGSDPDKQEQSVMPVSGVLMTGLGMAGRWYGGNAVFTFHFPDSIPFRERIEVTVEHGTENNMTNDFASTAYWYVRPGSEDFFFMRPVEERTSPRPEQWQGMYETARRRYKVEVLRQLSQTVAGLKNHPTDARRRGFRNRMIGRTVKNAELVGLSPEDYERLYRKWRTVKTLSPTEEWRILDEILLELGSILLDRQPF